ncbi:MAG: YggS family pyridoxal phosphate-dependent enzyme [Acidobacteriota bacterium]
MAGALSDPIATRLTAIRSRIEKACARSGRDAAAVTLVGASKTHDSIILRAAYDAGLKIFGENRVQEGQRKAPELPADCAWHLLGPLQTNKVRPAVATFSVFHAVDREKVARALDQECAARNEYREAFLEINLGGEESKHGFAVETLLTEAAPLAALAHLRVVGLMAIPPVEEDPERARAWFRRLRDLRDRMSARPEWSAWPGLLSMGMSADFEIAIEEGATHVRVGTALFGER